MSERAQPSSARRARRRRSPAPGTRSARRRRPRRARRPALRPSQQRHAAVRAPSGAPGEHRARAQRGAHGALELASVVADERDLARRPEVQVDRLQRVPERVGVARDERVDEAQVADARPARSAPRRSAARGAAARARRSRRPEGIGWSSSSLRRAISGSPSCAVEKKPPCSGSANRSSSSSARVDRARGTSAPRTSPRRARSAPRAGTRGPRGTPAAWRGRG